MVADRTFRSRAALLRAPNTPLELVELDVAAPGPGQVVVRMAAVGVCGSDLHVVRGEWPRPLPMLLGHEGSGRIEAIGPGVEGVREGDRVVLSWAPACGRCDPCRRGRRTACTTVRAAIGAGTMTDGTTGLSLAGETVYRMATVGALSELVLVPAAAALPLPDSVGDEDAALLGCAALTGVGAVLGSARVDAGETVAVIGAGGVGQFVVQGARLAGAAAIVAIDPNRGRLELTRTLGATATATPGELDELVAREFADGFDHAFEVVGAAETAELAVRLVRPGGRATLVGLPPAGTRLSLDPFEIAAREKLLTGSIYGSRDPAEALPGLLALVEDGSLAVGSLRGPSFPLERAAEAVAASLAGEPGRVLVTMP